MEKLDNETILKLRTMQRAEKDKRRHVKITVVLMLDGGFAPEDIAFAFGIDDSTVYRYEQKYRSSHSLDEYLQDNYSGSEATLTAEQLLELEAELRSRLYISAKEVCAFIDERFRVSYTPTGLVPLLKRLGFVYKKTRQVSPKANSELQEAFLDELDGLLDAADASAAAGRQPEVVYFTDAVHPQHNTRPCSGWIKSGEDFEVASNTGRERVNINGAVNALDVSDIVVREDERINAASTIALYEQLETKHPEGSIAVICDNARYYRSRLVKEWLKDSRVRQVFLPSYSPNLNLIERLWKFLRKKVIDAEHYATKQEFREAIFGFFKNIRQYRSELETLLTLNFHIA